MTSKIPIDIFAGVPDVLRPVQSAAADRLAIVKDGPRNLTARPFDYRNPFPLDTPEKINAEQANGPNTRPVSWPIADDRENFDYYANGNAAIGLPGGPECAIVDIFGTLRCFTGAWAFALGERRLAPDLRVRRLLDGHWPIVLAETQLDGVRYEFEYYACDIHGAPLCEYPVEGNGSYSWVGGMQPVGRNIFLCARCKATAVERAASVLLQLGFSQAPALCAGAFYCRPAYAPPWQNLRLERADGGRFLLLAEGTALGMLDPNGTSVTDGEGAITHWPDRLPLSPERTAAHCAAARQALPPGESLNIEWLVPLFPISIEDADCLLRPKRELLRQSTVDLWTQRRSSGMQIEIPERKVQDTFIQALNHLDLCCVTLDQTEFPTPGPSGGHHVFYDRDDVEMIHAYDLMGERKRAEAMIDNYWLRGVCQETSGMVLWLLGKHFAITGDRAWLQRMMPDVKRRMAWLIRTWRDSRGENDGLLPETSIGDNELIAGHFVSYHLYAVAGARAAAAMAEAAGERKLATQWNDFHEAFGEAVMAALEKLTAKTGGVITPGFEGYEAQPVTVNVNWVDKPYSYTPAGAYGKTGGCDWLNVAAAFPAEVLPADHPWITSSLARWRETYIEGIFPYPSGGDYRMLHNYNTMNLSETWLRRGDWAETLRDLYGLLLHTTATHASAECLASCGRRDMNCTPHNWFSAKLVRFVRDLLVYEGADRRLHLLAGLSPAWMAPGMRVGIWYAPTELGKITLRAMMNRGGMDIETYFHKRPEAEGMMLHLPPFIEIKRVEADGELLLPEKKGWPLPAGTRQVHVEWEDRPLPDISFARVVDAYVEDYRRRLSDLEQGSRPN